MDKQYLSPRAIKRIKVDRGAGLGRARPATFRAELKRTTPDALLRALQAGEVKLSEDDPTQGRDRSLSASLTYRLDALDATLHQRLGVLALFQGFVNAGLLAAMCQVDGAPDMLKGLGRDEWIRMLDVAAEVGLLRRVGKGYYTVHPALPWFFYDLLREALPGHLDWLEKTFSKVYGGYGDYLSDMFQTNAQIAMSLLSAEEGNLIYSLQLARRHELWDNVQGILYGLRTLFVTHGRWVEWERLIDEIESEVTDTNGEPLSNREDLWLSLLGHHSEVAQYHRDFDKVERIQLLGKAHFESHGDDRNLAAALHQLGTIAQERRQFDEAERWYRQSLAIEERIGNEHGQAQTLHQLGIIAQERRQFDEAESLYKQSLAIKERIGNEHGQAASLYQLGMNAEAKGNISEAVRFYKQSEALVVNLDDPYHLEMVRESLRRVQEHREKE